MFCHLMVYVRLVLTTLVIITCLIGDNFVELTQHPLLKALVDNATHAVIGALSGIAFVIQFYDRISNCFGWMLIFICFSVASLIDVDHFIEARSWRLEDATSIVHRPILHCTTIPIVLFIFFIATLIVNYFKTSLILGTLFCAFFTHHTRDATRRGYWICPLGHTDRISQIFYIFITVMTPYLCYYMSIFSHSNYVQHLFFGTSGKLSDTSKRDYRYSLV